MGSMVYEGQKFHDLRHIDEPCVVSGVTVRNCEFSGCVFGQRVDSEYPIRVQDATVARTRFVNNSVSGVLFEDVTVEDCVTSGDPMILNGCLFRRVTLRGQVGSWVINNAARSVREDVRADFAQAERRFYATGEYALDISEALFESASLFFLPGDLIKRDPETQFLVRKEKVVGADLSKVPATLRTDLKLAERNPYDSTVLVVGREDEDFDEYLAMHRQLVDIGLAEA